MLVQAEIFGFSGLSSLLAESGSSLTVSDIGTTLNYPITPKVSLTFVLDGSDTRSIGVSVIAEGRYEPLLQEALLAVASECSSFADVGANVGFYSIAVRATNPSCDVIAFECNPKVREHFAKNIELNGLDSISVRPEALSDRFEDADFYVPAFTGSGGGSLRDLHPEEEASQKFRVSVLPLDSLGLEHLDLLKIDVEGAELGVIRGGLSSLEISRPTIFVELLRKWMKPFGSSPQDVAGLLGNIGYLVFEITHEEITEVDAVSASSLATNYIFVHESRLIHLAIVRGLTRPR